MYQGKGNKLRMRRTVSLIVRAVEGNFRGKYLVTYLAVLWDITLQLPFSFQIMECRRMFWIVARDWEDYIKCCYWKSQCRDVFQLSSFHSGGPKKVKMPSLPKCSRQCKMLDRLTDVIALSSSLDSEPHVKKLEPDGSKTNASISLEYVCMCICIHMYEYIWLWHSTCGRTIILSFLFL